MGDPTGTSFGHYQVMELLGEGGMARVYKVWDGVRSTPLALKLLRDDLAEDLVFIRRFQREAQNLERLQHPNIVRFYGLEREGTRAFMLMDFIDGFTLRTEIMRMEGHPMSGARILEIMRPVCAALQYAHAKSIVHCDIKPANIMLSRNGMILVSDFGIARMTEGSTTVTMVGAGTPAYMAPEQIRGLNPVPQTDLYGLGIILYEMLTGGERPFTGEKARVTGTSGEKVRWEHINLTPESLRKYNPKVTPELEAVVMKCLAKDPSTRYAGAMEMLGALERALQGYKIETYPGSRVPLEEEVTLPPEPVAAPVSYPGDEAKTALASAPGLPPVSAPAVSVPVTSPPSFSTPEASAPAKSKRWIWVAAIVGVFCLAAIVGGGWLLSQFLPGFTIPLVVHPTNTMVPTSTRVVSVVPTNTVAPPTALLPAATSTPKALAIPTISALPQQWNGYYTYPSSGQRQNLTFLIEKTSGATFTGKMIWQSFGNSRGATLRMNGEFITDFGTGAEITKWNNLGDYQGGDRSGYWLKWTETAIIVGGNYTVNGWYYAHIRTDGTMVAIYFYNKDETVADAGSFTFTKVTP